jgi:hypothetical protein
VIERANERGIEEAGTEEVRANREKVMTFTAMTKHPECKEIWKTPLYRVIILSDQYSWSLTDANRTRMWAELPAASIYTISQPKGGK